MNQELLNQFLAMLEQSSSYKLLSAEDQAAVKANYQNTSDEQLKQAIQALEEDKVATHELAEKAKKREAVLEEESLQLKTTLREVERDERHEAEVADSATDKQEMQSLMQEIDHIEQPEAEVPKKKRKKFLGIF